MGLLTSSRLAGLSLLLAAATRAALLDPAGFTVRDAGGLVRPAAHDNDLGTGVLLDATSGVVRCVVDFGASATVHRVYFTPTLAQLDPGALAAPLATTDVLAVRVRVGSAPEVAGLVATGACTALTGREVRATASLRFPPAAGRFLVLELDRGARSNRWNLGELEVWGWPGDRGAEGNHAVLLEAGAPAPLRLAAAELSYYVGELEGGPVPIVAPAAAGPFTGTLFRIVNLQPLATNYAAMTNHQALGLLPAAPVNVERDGREIVFRAWPYRHVLWSVWEYLDRQGVKWVYPDAHGDFVPAGRGLDPEVAPFQYTPSTDFIYANFGVEFLWPDPDAVLHFWRNRWTHTWGGHERDVLGGSEVPARPLPAYTPQPDHVEGFDDYPHNFKNVLPERILAQHPEWCGLLTNTRWAVYVGAGALNQRLPPSVNFCTFDLTSAGARQFVVDKAIACWPDQLRRNGPVYWLLPEDATLFSEDPASLALRAPLVGDELPFTFPYLHAVSGDYYDFVRHVAEALAGPLPEARVGAMAYANTHLPPPALTRLPSNVLVDVVLYGARNLPLSAPPNAALRGRLEEWVARAAARRHYDYDLIHRESAALPLPVPLVHALADRARFHHARDMLAGGTQADLPSLRFNPWNYYAYPRFHWNVSNTADRVLDEFCTGYFAEAAGPLRDYYTTLERFLVANHVSLQAQGVDYGLRAGAARIALLRRLQQHLGRGETNATYWLTRRRVAAVREGFDWMLGQRSLTAADLASDAAFPTVSAGDTVIIHPQTARIRTAGQAVAGGWSLFSWAEVGDYVHFPAAGAYEIRIPVGGGSATSRCELVLRVGALEYGPFAVDHAATETYVFRIDLPAGVREVAAANPQPGGPFTVGDLTVAAGPSPALAGTRVFELTPDGNPAARIDSDWDGASDLYEQLSGTHELDPDSHFAAGELVPDEAGLFVHWRGAAGRRYAVYRSRRLTEDFELLADELTADQADASYLDAQPPADAACYRIVTY